MTTRRHLNVVALCTLLATSFVDADIYRWDTGEVIPETEGIELGPEEQLDHMQLEFALLANKDLTEVNLEASILTGASLESSILTDANLRDANLTRAGLSGATLAGADFSGSLVTNAGVIATTSLGFTAEQLYSTVSYRTGNLQGMQLGENDLTGWDFSGKDLRHAYCERSAFTNANLAGARMLPHSGHTVGCRGTRRWGVF